MYKRFLTFVLALFMTISLMSTSATATAISGNGETFPEPKVTTSTKDGFTIAETVPMDLSSVSPSNIINLPNAKQVYRTLNQRMRLSPPTILIVPISMLQSWKMQLIWMLSGQILKTTEHPQPTNFIQHQQ